MQKGLIPKILELVHEIHQEPNISDRIKHLAIELESSIKQNKSTNEISTGSPYSENRKSVVDCVEINVEEFEFSSGEKLKITEGKEVKGFDNDDLFCDEVYESMDEMNMRKQMEKEKTNEMLRPILTPIKELPEEESFLETRKKFEFETKESKKQLKISIQQKKKRFSYLAMAEEPLSIQTFFKLRNNL